MNIPKTTVDWILAVVDGERKHTPEFQAMLDDNPDSLAFYRQQKSLAVLLSRTVVPDAPEPMNDDIMAFLERHEPDFANGRSRPIADLLVSTWHAFLDYVPTFELPATVRREAWAVSAVAFAVLWGTLIGPLVQSGRAQAYLEPIRSNVIGFAGELREQSQRIPQQLRSVTGQIIESASTTFGISTEASEEQESAQADSSMRLACGSEIEWL